MPGTEPSEVTLATLTDREWHVFSDVVFRELGFERVVLRGVDVADLEIDGEIGRLVVNGVEVGPYVQAELDRREPDRAAMRPVDAAGFRHAWDLVEAFWAETVAHARTLPPDVLHEQVDDEWSFVQTLRHLVYATDSWVRRAVLGDPAPWDPLALPCDTLTDTGVTARTTPVEAPGWPRPESFEHHRFARRDLAVLEARPEQA